jgi:hypothetical protein
MKNPVELFTSETSCSLVGHGEVLFAVGKASITPECWGLNRGAEASDVMISGLLLGASAVAFSSVSKRPVRLLTYSSN